MWGRIFVRYMYILMFMFPIEDLITIRSDYDKGLMWKIFIIVVAAPVCKLTVTFVNVLTISYGPLNRFLYLYADLFLIIT